MSSVLERRRRAGCRPGSKRRVLAPSVEIVGALVPAPVERPEFPVDSFRAAAPHLRRPFSANAVRFKVQATWGDNGDGPTGGLVVAYIDARLVVERLNLVCPHLWHDDYALSSDGKQMLCRLTLDGITRQDIGEGYIGKGLYSDALKRAAVRFGVGVSLYAIPQLRLSRKDGMKVVNTRKGKSLALTPEGEARCRDQYSRWLASDGEAAFGPVLDHGDVEGSVGDLVEGPQTEVEPVTDTEGTDAIGAGPAKGIVDRAWKVDGAKRMFALAVGHITGREPGDCGSKPKAVAAIQTMTFGEAEKLDSWVKKKADEAKEGEGNGG